MAQFDIDCADIRLDRSCRRQNHKNLNDFSVAYMPADVYMYACSFSSAPMIFCLRMVDVERLVNTYAMRGVSRLHKSTYWH